MDGTVAVALAYGLKSSAGSTGDGTATLSGAEDNDGILFALKPCSSGGNYAPTAPTTPYLNNTTAQSGQATPATGITDPTPAFSAIYSDPDSGDIANKGGSEHPERFWWYNHVGFRIFRNGHAQHH
jgi:hypothetical protein